MVWMCKFSNAKTVKTSKILCHISTVIISQSRAGQFAFNKKVCPWVPFSLCWVRVHRMMVIDCYVVLWYALTVCIRVDSALATKTNTSASLQCVSIHRSTSGLMSIPGLQTQEKDTERWHQHVGREKIVLKHQDKDTRQEVIGEMFCPLSLVSLRNEASICIVIFDHDRSLGHELVSRILRKVCGAVMNLEGAVCITSWFPKLNGSNVIDTCTEPP